MSLRDFGLGTGYVTDAQRRLLAGDARRPQRTATGHELSIALMCAWVMMVTGCGGGPRVGDVSGVIRYLGEPMAGIEVSFDPVAGGRRSMAVTDRSGGYELQYTRGREGALVGEHRVRLVWPAQSEADLMQRKIYPIPSNYNTETTLTFEVKPGKNVFDLNIETK